MPFSKSGNNNRQRKNSQSSYNSRENSTERGFAAYGSRENSLDRRQHRRNRYNGRRGSEYSSSRENSTERFGVNWSRNNSLNNLREDCQSWRRVDEIETSNNTDQKIAELTKEFKNCVDLKNNEHRILFDPKNPSKPIVVSQSQFRPRDFVPDANEHNTEHQQYLSSAKPIWFKKTSEQYKNIKNKHLIDELDRLDDELMSIIDSGDLVRLWNRCRLLRDKIQRIFEELLCKDMRFCQLEHVEHHFWKLLFYRIIEVLRKQIQDCDEESKVIYKEKALETVDDGTRYLESLIKHLENCYKFQIDEYIGENAASYKSGMGYVTLALVSVQKIFLFLGDLARYREQINQTNNFGRAKNYYVKAQQVVPKNGRPFNQLALLAVYSVSMDNP
jgi:Telomerase activating protein Est1/Est1 DNA/RNA binding domain